MTEKVFWQSESQEADSLVLLYRPLSARLGRVKASRKVEEEDPLRIALEIVMKDLVRKIDVDVRNRYDGGDDEMICKESEVAHLVSESDPSRIKEIGGKANDKSAISRRV